MKVKLFMRNLNADANAGETEIIFQQTRSTKGMSKKGKEIPSNDTKPYFH